MSTCVATGCRGKVKPPESHCTKCKQRRHDASDRTECKTIMNVEDAWINEFVVVNIEKELFRRGIDVKYFRDSSKWVRCIEKANVIK